MGRAEVGTPKYVANQMKAKGLQRLRWYCQVCEKQCRDENGFKCHTLSESHVHKMLNMSQNASQSIERYSQQFKTDFLYLLRTGHGEKAINANRFYQDYIHKKDHIHMNATKWTSLSQFVKYLGREGICRVTESEKDGICIAYIDSTRPRPDKSSEKVQKSESEIAMKLLQRQIDAAKEEQEQQQQQEQEQQNGDVTSGSSEEVKMVPSIQISTSFAQKPTAKRKPKPMSLAETPASTKSNQSASGVSKETSKRAKRPQNSFERIMMREAQK